MSRSPADEFDEITFTLVSDPDDDVTSKGGKLFAKGKLFARLDGSLLAVQLPAGRAHELVSRGVAGVSENAGPGAGTWVRVSDASTWAELASEAHQFVGEPAVGSDS
ncbi:hypothetical protein GCM10027413_24600 [Conyzicola nivalis]|uniref:MmcQ/YjbR family DNA-binding protein n=1 Tax=Conyzicola nivalis TaxID=1477021 RepID=A0A916WEH2_9MICO|nr:hypothetical protein [Conyzicola nivalis]GGA90946.1 hypothetical protein GCM10010979_02020 [Conyzicola nivalis]